MGSATQLATLDRPTHTYNTERTGFGLFSASFEVVAPNLVESPLGTDERSAGPNDLITGHSYY